MKIAVIGNSHVVALQNAVDLYGKNFSELEFTFYAAPARDAHQIFLKDNKVVTNNERTKKFYKHTSNGREVIDLLSYDVIWLYGLTEQLDKIAAWYQNVYSSEAYSKKVKEVSYVDRYNIGFKLLEGMSDNNVVISPRPLPSDSSVFSSDCDYRINAMAPVIEHMKNRASEYGAHYLCQQSDTFHSELVVMTNPIFSEGSESLSLKSQKASSKESDRQDFLHMNALFGKHMLELFSKKLKEFS